MQLHPFGGSHPSERPKRVSRTHTGLRFFFGGGLFEGKAAAAAHPLHRTPKMANFGLQTWSKMFLPKNDPGPFGIVKEAYSEAILGPFWLVQPPQVIGFVLIRA